jgi:hypothetical protein
MTNDRADVLGAISVLVILGLPSSFVICHSSFSIDISRPNELLINLSLALFVLVSLVMVLVILMQRPKSEGLGAAFVARLQTIFSAHKPRMCW